jgi:SAM-dependent methyltransferase
MAHPLHDQGTVEYFDRHAPEYGESRLDFAAGAIRERAGASSSLLDLGCGSGNTLAHLGAATGIDDLVGVDVSRTLLGRAAERGLRTVEGSILDPALPGRLGRRFDFVVVAAVLHHLVGRSRSASKRNALTAVANGMRMVEPGGHLVIVEPVWYPRVAMVGLFWAKAVVSRLTASRVPLGGEWNNIGAPVVAYYTNEELLEMVAAQRRATIAASCFEPAPLGRLNAVFNKTDTTLVVRREPG